MRKKTLSIAAAAALAIVGVAASASARPGYVGPSMNLRAGPGTDFPAAALIAAGAAVEIYGCLSGWGWCEVGYNGNHGWVSGQYLQVPQYGPVVQYGPQVGISITVFNQPDYWDRYYRGRPFYHQWEQRGRPPHHVVYAPPRPAPHQPAHPANVHYDNHNNWHGNGPNNGHGNNQGNWQGNNGYGNGHGPQPCPPGNRCGP
ncbi:SH3 domain-containing protein [Radicibacter daui]|uniref:SH3 domain-containing protein n=1 Tax=Radicibacter daui TaxID=3064829 RepID=UPI004046F2DF